MKSNTMSILSQFHEFLISQPHSNSKLTVKNYVSDIRHFMKWYEASFHRDFRIEEIDADIIHLYTQVLGSTINSLNKSVDTNSSLSPSSLKRHLSSLRKFEAFLLSKDLINSSLIPSQPEPKIDLWKLKEFKFELMKQNASNFTIKNYINDIQNFSQWHENSYPGLDSKEITESLNQNLLDMYQKHLTVLLLSQSTINRKLSSLRKYFLFRGIEILPIANTEQLSENKILLEDILSNNSELPIRQYARFLPFKLAQLMLAGYDKLEENTATFLAGKKAQGALPKEPTYKPKPSKQKLLKKGFSLSKYETHESKVYSGNSFLGKLGHTIRHKRPQWYHLYHSYSVTHYFHLAILIMAGIMAGGFVYQTIYSPVKPTYAAENSHLIPFQGKIASAKGGKIPTEQKIRFAIYDDPLKNEHSLLWEETQQSIKIKPDGTFSTLIGSTNPIPDELFNDPNLYLGIQIGQGPELKPRKQMASLGYSLDSASLSNMLPITDLEADTKNVILALDSAGDLTIGGTGDHTFQVSGGIFTLSGQTIQLTTERGTNSNVELAPDGLGKIDVQKALVNSTDNGVISPGSVEVADSFTVNAANEFEPSLLVNSTGTGDLLVASSSGTARFVVSQSGNVGIGTDIPNLPLSVKGSAYVSERMGIGTLLPASNLDVRGESSLMSGNKDFALHISKGESSSSAALKFQDSFSSRAMVGLLGNNDFQIRVSNNSTTWYDALTIDDNNGNVGIGTTSPSDRLTVSGNIAPTEGSKYDLGTSSRPFNKLYVNEIIGPTVGIQGFWQRNGATLNPTTTTDSIILGSPTESSAIIKLSGVPNTNSWINSGNLGLGTTTPSFKLDVLDSQDTTSMSRITNTSLNPAADVLSLQVGNATPTTSNYFLSFQNGSGSIIGKVQGNGVGGVMYTTTGSDFAEYYKKENPEEVMEPGDLVCLAEFGITKCTDENNHIVGVISNQAGFVGNSKYENLSAYALVGLLGQVPIKTISDADLQNGDALTFSSIPGKAAKATKPGMIVGKITNRANLQTADISLSPTWYDPEIFLSSSGDIQIETSQTNPQSVYSGLLEAESQIQNQEYSVKQNNQVIKDIRAFGKVVSARISAGLIETENAIVKSTLVAQNIVTEKITIQGKSLDEYITQAVNQTLRNRNIPLISQKIESPLASIQQIRTNVISPLDGDNISIDLKTDQNTSSGSSKLNIRSDQKTVASIDNQGNAEFAGQISADSATISGQLSSNSLQTSDATISGTLRANKIVADDIDGLNDQIATITQRSLETIRQNNNLTSLPHTGEFMNVATLSADFAMIQESFVSFGTSTFREASVTDRFAIGTNFVFSQNSLDVIGEDLQIQPLRQGGVSFMAGLVQIDTNGDMTIEGDLNIKGSLFAQNGDINNLKTGILSPLSDSVSVLLASESANLNVRDASNSAVFAVNPKGDVEASGSATISKLNLKLAGQAYALTDTESVATGSAGMAYVKKNQREMTIHTPFVTEDSLIYVTPVGDTQNTQVYLLRQAPQESFTVGVSKLNSVDIPFNWIIIN